MLDIPFEIVDYIMKYKGAYYLNNNDRPYIKSIKQLKDITQYGVKRTIIHHKELNALEKAYDNYLEGYPTWFPIY